MPDIYALLDPDTKEIRYIGKANDVAKRMESHLRDARRRKTPVYCWINSLLADGKMPEIKVIELDCADWKASEKQHVARLRDSGYKLLNLAEGGNEPYASPEVRAANGRKVSAIVHHGDPRRKRLWELKRLMGMALKQGIVSDDRKQRLRLLAQRCPDLFACYANL